MVSLVLILKMKKKTKVMRKCTHIKICNIGIKRALFITVIHCSRDLWTGDVASYIHVHNHDKNIGPTRLQHRITWFSFSGRSTRRPPPPSPTRLWQLCMCNRP